MKIVNDCLVIFPSMVNDTVTADTARHFKGHRSHAAMPPGDHDISIPRNHSADKFVADGVRAQLNCSRADFSMPSWDVAIFAKLG